VPFNQIETDLMKFYLGIDFAMWITVQSFDIIWCLSACKVELSGPGAICVMIYVVLSVKFQTRFIRGANDVVH